MIYSRLTFIKSYYIEVFIKKQKYESIARKEGSYDTIL
jgi:hypothetical protein